MPASSDDQLIILRDFAAARRARGDVGLTLNPSSEPRETYEPPDEHGGHFDQGLVLEPSVGSLFRIQRLSRRREGVRIGAYCDGVRSSYFLGFEDVYPILYTTNAAAVRKRDETTGYHGTMESIQRKQHTLLAPFGLFRPALRGAYERLGLCATRLADLCWIRPDDDEYGLTPLQIQSMGSLAWQARGMRRARRLLDISEQVVALAAARRLQERYAGSSVWLLKDGSLFQFDKMYLRQRSPLRQVVACVKTHPVLFFGVEGERQIAELEIGERSVAFLPRPLREAQMNPPRTLTDTDRPMVSWYLRVHPPLHGSPNRLSGVVRLDIAATHDWERWIEDLSWAVLNEFYGLSALPDPRSDVMPYGIYDCEQYLKAQQISGELLLAQLM